MKCPECGLEMEIQGYRGSKGGFYPFRKPTIYRCLHCGCKVTLVLVLGDAKLC